MASISQDCEVLCEFDYARRNGECTLVSFLNGLERGISPELQLELTAIDIEIGLRFGEELSPYEYFELFPHLQDEILETYESEKQTLLDEFCPFQEEYGSFPIQMGEYTVLSELGRGGMAVVYKAVHGPTNLNVALKVRFTNRHAIVEEAEIVSRITHPSICRLLKIETDYSIPFLSFQLIEGASLRNVIESRDPDPRWAARTIMILARGLAESHSAGYIHFDIKPENILLSHAGQPFIADFGAAKKRGIESTSQYRAGSIHYLAPELVDSNFGEPGVHSDIYSLGVVLYELLTGETPFIGSEAVVTKMLRRFPPGRPSDFPGLTVDEELEKICLRALEKQVKDRYQDMNSFVDAIVNWLG